MSVTTMAPGEAAWAELGVELPGTSIEAKIRCPHPEHEDRHPSCSANRETGLFRCYACGFRGSVYDAAVARGWSSEDATTLKKRHGLYVPVEGDRRSLGPQLGRRVVQVPQKERKPEKPPPTEEEVKRDHQTLLSETALLRELVEAKGWPLETLVRFELGFTYGGQGMWRERFTVPLRNELGRLAGKLLYLPPGPRRDARSDEDKILAQAGSKRQLYPAPEQLNEGDGWLWLVEGELDAISAWALGLVATAIPGVNGWKREWVSRFAGRRVAVCCDCDEGGRELALRAATDLYGVAADVKIRDLDRARTNGYDLGSLLLEEGGRA